LRAGLDVSTKALPHGGEHFLGEGVLFARAETGISLKTGLHNSVPAERNTTLLLARRLLLAIGAMGWALSAVSVMSVMV
jgi:hypothetical protein